MTGDQTVGVIWAVGALVFVGSALIVRRIAPGDAMKMALAWVAIFALVAAIVSWLRL